MALLKYFKRKDSVLPSPSGPLSEQMPSSSIASANNEVKDLVFAGIEVKKVKRGPYIKYSDEERFKVGKYASEMGVTKSLKFFKNEFADRPLKESTVRGWKTQYEKELKLNFEISGKPARKLVSGKRGHPLLLGNELDKRLQDYITQLRVAGGVVNAAIVEAAAVGIVKDYDSNLLQCNGGHICLGKSWSKSFLTRMGFVKRRSTTKSKVEPAQFEENKNQFILDIQGCAVMENIPKELIINWDHTGINYVPVSSWTLEKQGAKRVEIAGADDKRQITVVFGNTMSGDFLPVQVIYSGKTKRSVPTSITFPKDWHVTYTQNHWANETTTEAYINQLLFPYIVKKRAELHLPPDKPALVIFDRFKGQCTQKILNLLDNNNVRVCMVPANCTDRLQPLDVSINKAAKEYLRNQFQQWYSEQVCKQLKEESQTSKVDLSLSVMKPLGAKWLISLYEYLRDNPSLSINGYKEAGLLF
jgi:hypothetical protein